jgi:hypothetical protein
MAAVVVVVVVVVVSDGGGGTRRCQLVVVVVVIVVGGRDTCLRQVYHMHVSCYVDARSNSCARVHADVGAGGW